MNLKKIILTSALIGTSCAPIKQRNNLQMQSNYDQLVLGLIEQNFEQEVLHSNVPVIIDFYTTWCIPCRYANRGFEELAREHTEVRFASYDCDNGEVCDNYNIRTLPTFLIFKNGEEIAGQKGFIDKAGLEYFLEDNL